MNDINKIWDIATVLKLGLLAKFNFKIAICCSNDTMLLQRENKIKKQIIYKNVEIAKNSLILNYIGVKENKDPRTIITFNCRKNTNSVFIMLYKDVNFTRLV